MRTVIGRDQPSNLDIADVYFILLRKVRGGELQIIHGQPATIGLVGMSNSLPRGIKRSAPYIGRVHGSTRWINPSAYTTLS